MSVCKHCHRSIVWMEVTNASGERKAHPVDPEYIAISVVPSKGKIELASGELLVTGFTSEGNWTRGVRPPRSHVERVRVSHFATCPSRPGRR